MLSDLCFHTLIGEQKPPRSKLRGGDYLPRRRSGKFEAPGGFSLNLCVNSRLIYRRIPSPVSEAAPVPNQFLLVCFLYWLAWEVQSIIALHEQGWSGRRIEIGPDTLRYDASGVQNPSTP